MNNQENYGISSMIWIEIPNVSEKRDSAKMMLTLLHNCIWSVMKKW